MRLIDADALLENVKHAVYTDDLSTTIAVGICEAHIREMPTIDAALVKHGRWVMMDGMKPPEWHHHHQCSVCESYAPMKPPYGGRKEFPPFCPACGAKMDLEG